MNAVADLNVVSYRYLITAPNLGSRSDKAELTN
jgi:hypothetical protein